MTEEQPFSRVCDEIESTYRAIAKAVSDMQKASTVFSLSPKARPGPWRPSRDYDLSIACARAGCPLNRDSRCGMPSAVKITSGGRCETGDRLVSEKPPGRPVDGD